MKILFMTLLFAAVLTACGGPVANTDYLVQNDLTVTPGIPYPFKCYNGFDPYHNTNQSNGLCDFQPKYNPTQGYPFSTCTGSAAHGYVELINNNPYYTPGSYCAKVGVTYKSGYWPANVLALNGWDQNFAGDATAAPLYTRITTIKLGPSMRVTYTDAPNLVPGAGDTIPCSQSDPDYDTCVTVNNTSGVNSMTINTSGVSINAIYVYAY